MESFHFKDSMEINTRTSKGCLDIKQKALSQVYGSTEYLSLLEIKTHKQVCLASLAERAPTDYFAHQMQGGNDDMEASKQHW